RLRSGCNDMVRAPARPEAHHLAAFDLAGMQSRRFRALRLRHADLAADSECRRASGAECSILRASLRRGEGASRSGRWRHYGTGHGAVEARIVAQLGDWPRPGRVLISTYGFE